MRDPNHEMLAEAVRQLRPLGLQIVFVGGATIGLYLNPRSAAKVRTTLDVDCILPVKNRAALARLEARLRELGFDNGMEPDDPVCRWRVDDAIIDIMPIDESILGFGNRFYKPGYDAAHEITLDDGLTALIMPAPLAFVTKIEAYRGRGQVDPWTSKDLEDLILLLEGRAELIDEISDASVEVRSVARVWACDLLSDPNAVDLIEGHLTPGPLHEERAERLKLRIEALAQLPS